jgi:transcriptional regulator with XRE-family HTH domain
LSEVASLRFGPAPGDFGHGEERNLGELCAVRLANLLVARAEVCARGDLLELRRRELRHVRFRERARPVLVDVRVHDRNRRLGDDAHRRRDHLDRRAFALVAREAGVSRTLLGQIEIGRAAPSIGVVWKIAQTLGVPFSALLSTEPRGGTAVTHRATAKRLLSAEQRFSSRALFPLGDPHAPEFYELWLAPHSREDAEAHRRGTRENLVVTAGTLELHIGRDVRRLTAGDAIVFTADVDHNYVNVGREDCWFYLVMWYPPPR